jgi:UDP-N-acetyl-D-glucosamine dehydrogenase
MRKLVVVGQGYVGLPLAMRAVEIGYQVVGFEIDPHRLRLLTSGSSYIEDVSAATVAAALASGHYQPTDRDSAVADYDVAVITVPTPLHDGVPDLSFVRAAAGLLGSYLRVGATVILESTTYPGTTNEVVRPILESHSELTAGSDFFLGYSPERIDPGNPNWALQNTPKVVSGISESSLKAVAAFFDSIVDRTIPVSSPEVAELAKILENTFRHVNIALVNELAMVAADLGIDVWEVIAAASTKPFGFMPFTPGPGVGGHCLPVDPSYLSWRVKQTLGTPFRFIELAMDINDHMPVYVVQRLMVGLNARGKPLKGSQVLVLGLAYKRNSGDARQSPGTVVCDRLSAFGADVRAVDPLLTDDMFPTSARRADLTEENLLASDGVVVITDHDCFDWQLVASTPSYVLDTRHRLEKSENVELL